MIHHSPLLNRFTRKKKRREVCNNFLKMRSFGCIIFCALHAVILDASSGWPVFDEQRNKCVPNPSAYDVGERSTCTFIKQVNYEAARIPAYLPEVRCKCPENHCSSKGDFRCLEVKRTFSVFYKNLLPDGTLRGLAPRQIELPTSCVCAASQTAEAGIGVTRSRGFNTTVRPVPVVFPVVVDKAIPVIRGYPKWNDPI